MIRVFILAILLLYSPLALARSYHQADNRAYKVSNQFNDDLDGLINYLIEPFKNDDEMKARVLFAWIVYHIQYDQYEAATTYEYRKNLKQTGNIYSPQDTFKKRLGVCRHFANLFFYMAKKSGLEAEIILGKSEGVGHAWNAVKIKDKWRLLDTTWASRNKTAFRTIKNDKRYQRELKKRENTFNKNKTKGSSRINEKWFFTDPKVMIKTHTPNDPKWRLF